MSTSEVPVSGTLDTGSGLVRGDLDPLGQAASQDWRIQ